MTSTRVSLVALTFAVGCTSYMPAAERPDTNPPQVPQMPAAPEGHGRVIVDVVDGPTDVFVLTNQQIVYDNGPMMPPTYRTRLSRDLLCTSPCAVDLPHGRHVLQFPTMGNGNMMERDVLNVGPQPVVYRRRLGIEEDAGAGRVLGIVGATFGGMAMVVGVVFLPVGAGQGEDGMMLAGAIVGGAGVALLVAGILGIVLDTRVVQRGSSVTFLLD